MRHPEVVDMGSNRLAVVYPNTDRIMHVALAHSNSIQALQAV